MLLLVAVTATAVVATASVHLIGWWLSLLILQNLFAPNSVGEVMTNWSRDCGIAGLGMCAAERGPIGNKAV